MLGGTAGREAATVLSVVFCIEEVLLERGEAVEGQRVVIQGIGKVGGVVARELANRGARVTGISGVSAAPRSPQTGRRQRRPPSAGA